MLTVEKFSKEKFYTRGSKLSKKQNKLIVVTLYLHP